MLVNERGQTYFVSREYLNIFLCKFCLFMKKKFKETS